MKKIYPILIFLLISVTLHAQKDVTEFMGIPVDGSKNEMIQKLKNKGFTISQLNKDVLTGEFNGRDVDIYVVTNNNKVYRIMVCDANSSSEGNIKIRYNNLCQQFMKNERYMPTSFSSSDYTLSDEEKISYEMLVNNKRYQASFYQLPPANDPTAEQEYRAFLSSKYTKEQLSNPTEELQNEISRAIALYILERYSKKSVWFKISDDKNGKYSISMFYDNEYNQANGEDL